MLVQQHTCAHLRKGRCRASQCYTSRRHHHSHRLRKHAVLPFAPKGWSTWLQCKPFLGCHPLAPKASPIQAFDRTNPGLIQTYQDKLSHDSYFQSPSLCALLTGIPEGVRRVEEGPWLAAHCCVGGKSLSSIGALGRVLRVVAGTISQHATPAGASGCFFTGRVAHNTSHYGFLYVHRL